MQEQNGNNKAHTSFYIPVRTAANDGTQHLHKCANCGHEINTYNMRDLTDYYTCPGCGCKMLDNMTRIFRKYGLADGDSMTAAISEAINTMLKNEKQMNAVRETSAGLAMAYYGNCKPDEKGFEFND